MIRLSEKRRDELVQRVNVGDLDALQQLLMHYHDILRGFAQRELNPEMMRRIDPEDVLQEAYADVFQNVDALRFDNPGHFYKWLEQVVRNAAQDLIRALHRKKRDIQRERPLHTQTAASYPDLLQRLAGDGTTPSQNVSRRENVAVLMVCLARLTPDQREVVRLRFLEDEPVAEITQRLGKSENAVYTLCHRGLKNLREMMETLSRSITGR